MIKTIDFSTLSLQDALDFAILVEEEACERYRELTEQMKGHHTADAAKFFTFMVGNEAKHGEELSARRRKLFGDAPRRVDGTMIFEVEAPAYEKVRAFMTAREALEVALESEQKAHAFFVSAIEHVTNPEVKELFEELRDEEDVHQDLVRREIAKLPAEPDVDTSDLVDEPVAQ